MNCQICPRRCGAKRSEVEPGLCGVQTGPGSFRVVRTMVHHWEEPYISGSRGSGTVFFSGCALGCLFCQNHQISQTVPPWTAPAGNMMTMEQLVDQLEDIAATGVHNLNLVTASHYALEIPDLISRLRQRGIQQPIVWNTGSYERVETLQKLAGTVSVYLPDFKFWDSELSFSLAKAPDYAVVAAAAILEMHRQQPRLEFDSEGLLCRGVALRHLVLPGHYRDSLNIIDWIAAHLPEDIPVAIMSQYTPFEPLRQQLSNHPELMRRVTTYEYNKVVEHAQHRGLTRLVGQRRDSAVASYTPDF